MFDRYEERAPVRDERRDTGITARHDMHERRDTGAPSHERHNDPPRMSPHNRIGAGIPRQSPNRPRGGDWKSDRGNMQSGPDRRDPTRDRYHDSGMVKGRYLI